MNYGQKIMLKALTEGFVPDCEREEFNDWKEARSSDDVLDALIEIKGEAMTELTEYLIELAKLLDVDTDTTDCVNPNLALSARIVMEIDVLQKKAKICDDVSAHQKYLNEMTAWRNGETDIYPKP